MQETLRGSQSTLHHAEARLRALLRANSLFSALTGASGLIAGGPVSDLLGVDQVWLIRLIAGSLLFFAAGVFATSRSAVEVLARGTLVISGNDFGWVAGTIAIVVLDWLPLRGDLVLVAVGVPVLGLGFAQLQARARALRTTTGIPAQPATRDTQ